ncbi:hypothetical protein OESDEN_07707 [Oesophagostomum dentatum]|uniref:Uncharacterized protein n=1 Tax=Oesophagostomum dentatum TaxID=61180 RepID=A0A0B1T8C5_OESDE|nr:hypothetical protein OESDEN_07707 [Oesophagostomum dentatum]
MICYCTANTYDRTRWTQNKGMRPGHREFLAQLNYKSMLQQLLRASLPCRLSLRWNCPWHRNNFRPCFFPFKMAEKLNKDTIEARTKTRGGRLMLMRRVLREQPFLGYITRPQKSTKISFPL